jgi:hypothetical protein
MESVIWFLFTQKLAEPFDLSVPSAKTINLPPPTSEYDAPAGTVFTVSGWGTTRVIFRSLFRNLFSNLKKVLKVLNMLLFDHTCSTVAFWSLTFS